MEELYSIMRELLEVKYNQDSLLYFLKTVEIAYADKQQTEAKLIANSTKYYLKALRRDLEVVINRLDIYIVEQPKEQ